MSHSSAGLKRGFEPTQPDLTVSNHYCAPRLMKEVDNLRWVMLGVLARLNTIQYFFYR